MTEVFVVVTHDNRFVGVHATERAAQREIEWMGRNLHISREELSDAPDNSPSLSLSQIDSLEACVNHVTGPAIPPHERAELLKTLRSLRELNKEDDGGC